MIFLVFTFFYEKLRGWIFINFFIINAKIVLFLIIYFFSK
ncbi:hypothetical protein HMPREF1871_01136 [Gemelliphila asaccharolytica]|uniref:Uncharacterized protein n=1 Tax=Gemelliphila asaccharolytica TaxID=502393 RepID=A0ABR5TNY4_9BACL|nr:hypothetical protein HMPREF1871_01136 [Gemella asaccharolytica]